jgi:hypothetical protein
MSEHPDMKRPSITYGACGCVLVVIVDTAYQHVFAGEIRIALDHGGRIEYVSREQAQAAIGFPKCPHYTPEHTAELRQMYIWGGRYPRDYGWTYEPPDESEGAS